MNIRKNSGWNVKPVDLDVARSFVAKHHYTGGCSNTGLAFGLFYGACQTPEGVAIWLPPALGAAKQVLPGNPSGVMGLSRFVLKPSRPEYSGSYFLSRCVPFLEHWSLHKRNQKQKLFALLSFADSYLGHSGGLYRASNFLFAGETKPQPIYRNVSTGQLVSCKKGAKTYSSSQMLETYGCEMIGKYHKHRFVYPIDRRNISPSVRQYELAFSPDGQHTSLPRIIGAEGTG